MKAILFVFAVIILGSCINGNVEYYRNPDSNIQIYLVKENQVEFHDSEIDIKSLELERNPWVKDSDIEFYDWSAHSFYLNKEINKGDHSGRHFIITSEEKRLFVGIFWPMYMSSIPMIPAITPEEGLFSPKDVVRFSQFGISRPGSLNENHLFKSELLAAGILREGINVEITNLKRVNSNTLTYTYMVTNNDLKNIYILDPKEMGDSRFHYYTNGVSLIKDNNYYWANNFESTESNKIKSNWYYNLKPGKSKSWTVKLDGFDGLPTGKVKATFCFPGSPIKKTGEWQKSDGRIWLGDLVAEEELTLR